MEQVIQALNDLLSCVEPNLENADTEEQIALIPKIIRSYIALAKLTNTPIEEVYKQRKGPEEETLPSVMFDAIDARDDYPEWEWAENLIADMWRGIFKDCKKVRIFISTDDDRCEVIEVEGRPHEVISSFWVPQTDDGATQAIAEIIEMCFEYHGFEVIPATEHWPEEEEKAIYQETLTLLPVQFDCKSEAIEHVQDYHGANGYGWIPAIERINA